MSNDPRLALDQLVLALQEHLAAAAHRSGDDDPRVERAYSEIADAFEVYEDALYTAYEEVTPFELFDDVEDLRADGGFDGEDFEDDLDDDDDLDDGEHEHDDDDLDDDDLDDQPEDDGRS